MPEPNRQRIEETMKNRLVKFWLLGFLVLAGAAPVRAAGQDIRILVDVFSASEQPGGISANLEYIRVQLGKTPFKFNSYRSLGTFVFALKPGEAGQTSFSLDWNLGVEVRVLDAGADAVALRLVLRREGAIFLSTDLDLARGGTVLVGGPVLADGVMMIALTDAW